MFFSTGNLLVGGQIGVLSNVHIQPISLTSNSADWIKRVIQKNITKLINQFSASQAPNNVLDPFFNAQSMQIFNKHKY